MNILHVPFEKINYINFSKEMYDKSVYNYIKIEMSTGIDLYTSVAFSWREEDAVPVELVEFIKNAGLDLNNIPTEKK